MKLPAGYTVVEESAEDLHRREAPYEELAQAVRELGDATVRTLVAPGEVSALTEQVRAVTERLRREQIEGGYGNRVTPDRVVVNQGNATTGGRNMIAPPLRIECQEDRTVTTRFHLGAVYEGPPTFVHGGVSALILDQVLGEAAAAAGRPGMTGTLTLRYRRPTPLGWCSAEARLESSSGAKSIVEGVIRDAEGTVTVEAEGIFVLPRWARESPGVGWTEDPARRFE